MKLLIFTIIIILTMIVKRHLRRKRGARLSTECPHKCSLLTKGENKGADDVFVADRLYICQNQVYAFENYHEWLPLSIVEWK